MPPAQRTPWSVLQELREESGLSLAQVCDRAEKQGAKLTTAQLSRIERGLCPRTAHETVALILRALGVSWHTYARRAG